MIILVFQLKPDIISAQNNFDGFFKVKIQTKM